RSPGVAVADLSEEVQRLIGCLYVELAQAALWISQGAFHQCANVILRKRLKSEQLAAAQQRRVDGEKRVLRGRADQDDDAFLHIRKQQVLLGFVEAMQFIEEKDGALGGGFQFFARGGENLPHFLDTGCDGIERTKAAPGVQRDDVGQRCL